MEYTEAGCNIALNNDYHCNLEHKRNMILDVVFPESHQAATQNIF